MRVQASFDGLAPALEYLLAMPEYWMDVLWALDNKQHLALPA